jgi:hypothetical protein
MTPLSVQLKAIHYNRIPRMEYVSYQKDTVEEEDMCFGAPSNPPVFLTKHLTQQEIPTYVTQKLRPYWNGKFREDEELCAIKEILETVPSVPLEYLPVHVEYRAYKPINKGDVLKEVIPQS